jgi:hypothetical protein
MDVQVSRRASQEAWIVAVIGIALALLVAGCGPARHSGGGGDTSLVAVSPSDVTTKILGGTPQQRKVLREVLAGIGPTKLEEVEIKQSQQKPGYVGLVVPHDAENVLAAWHTWLLAQGFAERSRELDLPVVSFLAGERGALDGESLGPVPAGPGPTLSDAMRAAAAARRAAKLHGAEVRRLEILKPHGYAFLVELQVEGDQARFLRYGLPRVLHFLGGPQPIEETAFTGDYALVLDGDGQRVWEGAEAATGHQMGGAYRRDLVECGPYLIFGPPRHRTPCPADPASPSLPKTRITGATPKQETILREILTGLEPTAIETVHVVPAGEWAPDDPTAVSVRVEYAKTADATRSEWEAVLLAKAFAAHSKSLNLPAVVALDTEDGGEALGDEFSDVRRQPITADSVTASVEEAAQQSGAELVDLELLRPHGLAFAVTLRTETPAAFLKHRLRRFLEEIPDPSHAELDGRCVSVIDAEDRHVWSWGLYPYGGLHWVRPELDGCDPVVPLGSPMDYMPPPCPAK